MVGASQSPKKGGGRVAKVAKRTVAGIFVLLLLAIVSVYLPPVQDFAVGKVLTAINEKGEMHLSVKRFRLIFPLNVKVDSLEMRTSGMDIAATRADLSVAVLPLFRGDICAPSVGVKGAKVNIGTPDSTLYMRANLQRAGIRNARVSLLSQKVDVALLTASSGVVKMVLKPDTVAEKEQSEPLQWQIALQRAQLRDVDYHLQMLPTIAALDCNLPLATLTDGFISMADYRVTVGELAVSKLDACYYTPSSADADATAAASTDDAATPATDSVASTPWTILANKIRVVDSHALYATEGATPATNFDPSYIEASDVNIEVDSLYNCGTRMRVPLTRLSARERCGLVLNANGTFSMDSTAMHATDFLLTTPATTITLTAMVGLEPENPPVDLNVGAQVAIEDVEKLLPAALHPVTATLPRAVPLKLAADISGRMNSLQVKSLSAELPRYLSVTASGRIADYSDLNRAVGSLAISGKLLNGDFIKPTLFDAKMQRQVNLPPLTLTGKATLDRGTVDGNLKLLTGSGSLALDAMWNNRREGYDINLAMNDFPIQSILPLSQARDITATVSLNGMGLDPFSAKTVANARVDLVSARYVDRDYKDVSIDALVSNGHADVEAHSANRAARFDLQASGNLAGDTYNWNFTGDIQNIDLQALALTETTADGSISLSGDVSYRPPRAATRRLPAQPTNVTANVQIADLYWHMTGDAVNASDINLKLTADDSITCAVLDNHDLTLDFDAAANLDSLLIKLGNASTLMQHYALNRRIAVDSLQQALPPFQLAFRAGSDNVMANYLQGHDITIGGVNLALSNDNLITGNARLTGLRMGSTAADTLNLNLRQKDSYLLYELTMNNRPGTFDQFAYAEAKGYLNADRLALILKQQNLQGETGYSLGLMASMPDSASVNLRFVPYHPIIGYKEWEVNRDNYITVNLKARHIDANLDMESNESSLKLFTTHDEEVGDSVQEAINLQLANIKISDWIAINPFAPAITGTVSGEVKVTSEFPNICGTGTVSVDDFTYGKERVGNFALDFDVDTNPSGTIYATTTMSVNGEKTMTISGNLNDSTAVNPFMLDFRVIRFPLAVVNPFLPKGTAKLTGVLNGEMDVTGDMTNPILNGFLDFDSTAVNVTMLGTPLTFSEARIPVENNVVKFNNFSVKALNDNPLRIDGTVDINDMTSPRINLAMKASNMQIVGSQRTRKSQVYGKAYVDINAKVNGPVRMLNVDASLNLLPGSNVTYVMLDAVSDLTSTSTQDMVKFVNFNDTTTVEKADTIAAQGMMMSLDARLTVSSGTTVGIDLSSSGKDRVQLQSSGTLNYNLDYMGDERFTGRLDLSDGYARYNIPVMGEKMFNFNSGSYVVFNGDMMSPQLNISATDEIRASVTSGSNSRMVNFDVGLGVTGTLTNMDVAFDLSCDDDITVANELKSMSAEQRANQAMNLLITGIYRSSDSQTSTSNVGTNALFSFIESQVNSWASSAIKGVDLSFGINQYDSSTDGTNSTSMSYSYRVSKSLFDDRFKIVVGGNYATDAEADENFAQNLIADISFEYLLNKTGTMYVKLFRHTGYESILEGEITQTGVGFVYKKKVQRLLDLFLPTSKKKRNE